MEEKLIFPRQRDFGDKLNVVFAFMRQNFKPLLRAMFYVLSIPILLSMLGQLLALEVAGYYGGNLSDSLQTILGRSGASAAAGSSVMGITLLFSLVSVVISTLLTTLVLSYIKLYRKQEGYPSPTEVWQETRYNFWRVLGFTFGYGFLIALMAVLVVLIPLLGILVILLGLPVILTYWCHVVPMAVFEPETSFGEALGRTFRLVGDQFWPVLGFYLVVMIIYIPLNIMVSLPSQIFSVLEAFMTADGAYVPGWLEALSSYGTIILTAVISLFTYMVYAFWLVANSVQYFDLIERREGTQFMEEVNQLGQTNPEEDNY